MRPDEPPRGGCGASFVNPQRSAACITHAFGNLALYTVDLTTVSLGIDEGLVAHVADQQGYYTDEGVPVALRDACTWDTDLIRRTATVGLGRALVSAVTDGVPWVVLCVNTQHPLFWLPARESFTTVDALKGRRIGIHSPRTAPGCFARIALRKYGGAALTAWRPAS